MVYVGHYGIGLSPSRPSIPFDKILRQWTVLKFTAEACQNSLDKLIAQDQSLERFFDSRELRTGGFCATEDLHYGIYGQSPRWDWDLFSRSAATVSSVSMRVDTSVSMQVGIGELSQLCGFLRSESQDDYTQEGFRTALRDLGADQRVIEAIVASLGDRGQGAGRWPSSRVPGIYRREHASLLFRSDTTTVVVDPQALSKNFTTNGGRYPTDDPDLHIDAVLITHHHEDHWHIPSILYMAQPDTTVIVPDVPKPNLLCGERFADSLADVGQAATVGEWDSTVTVGDIEIDILPFRGEQPTRGEPGPPPDLRSWGNCYRINTPHFSAVILADSGVDPSGDICPSLEASVKKRGPVDFLFSNCRVFPDGINYGLPHYSLALPFDRLQQIFADRQKGRIESITFGPSGVADACAAAQARYFLPYAHGFRGLGEDPIGEPSGAALSEASLVGEVKEAMRHRSPATQVASWHPGASVALGGDGLLFG
ncbi:MAG TPA: MBL fold metallo-hydrolase [Streptosporangiaceae bacterium]|jgi:L-ascorbate metabolism protein UlaG (beta-lactamase superfamily)